MSTAKRIIVDVRERWISACLANQAGVAAHLRCRDGRVVEQDLAAISNHGHKMNPLAVALEDNILGVCGFCVTLHEVTEPITSGGWPLLTENKGEASIRNLGVDG